LRKSPLKVPKQDRMSSDERRDGLIRTALELLREGGTQRLTIGTVAERVGVTRALVYKHFSNRQDLINTAYAREAEKLHLAIAEEVEKARDFEGCLRAFVKAVMNAVDSHGLIFNPQQTETHGKEFQRQQQQRNRRTLSFFSQMASEEFGLSLKEATSAMGVLLSGITSLRIQAHVLPTPEDRQFLADMYVDLVIGALQKLRNRLESDREQDERDMLQPEKKGEFS
jgi:AcrR family transcriptional regulator